MSGEDDHTPHPPMTRPSRDLDHTPPPKRRTPTIPYPAEIRNAVTQREKHVVRPCFDLLLTNVQPSFRLSPRSGKLITANVYVYRICGDLNRELGTVCRSSAHGTSPPPWSARVVRVTVAVWVGRYESLACIGTKSSVEIIDFNRSADFARALHF